MNQPQSSNESHRPLITFALFAYNQEQFIADAIRGAFSQTYRPLEIILSDDCSQDRTFDIMQQLVVAYQGPHKVILNRNQKNMGLGGHINHVMGIANGEVVVVAAGDDISMPQRTERLWQENLVLEGKAYSIFSNEYLIDIYGNKRALGRQSPPDPKKLTLDWFVHHQASITGSSHAWKRDVFDFFGPLEDQVVSEDVAIPFRSLLLGSIHYIHEPLVLRRYTGVNLSLGSFDKWNTGTSVKQFHTYSLRHAKNFQALYETRLLDIDKFFQISSERQDELTNIRAVTVKKLYRVQAEVHFWESSHFEKFQILFQDFIKNGFYTTAVRLFGSWVFPRFYLRWQHYVSVGQRGDLTKTDVLGAAFE